MAARWFEDDGEKNTTRWSLKHFQFEVMCACVALHTCTLTLGEEKWRWWWWWWRKRWRRRRKFYLNAIIKIHIECLTLAAKNTTMQVHIDTQREGENATDLSTMNYVYVTEWIITLTALSSLYTFNKLLCINDFRKCCRLQFGILMLGIRWKSLTKWIQVKFIQVDLAACFCQTVNSQAPSFATANATQKRAQFSHHVRSSKASSTISSV